MEPDIQAEIARRVARIERWRASGFWTPAQHRQFYRYTLAEFGCEALDLRRTRQPGRSDTNDTKGANL